MAQLTKWASIPETQWSEGIPWVRQFLIVLLLSPVSLPDSVILASSSFSLDNCDYYGLQTSRVASKSFNIKDLKEIRSRQANVDVTRPKENAKLYLTEAKLIDELNVNDDAKYDTALGEFCINRAFEAALDGHNTPSMRYILIEGFQKRIKNTKT